MHKTLALLTLVGLSACSHEHINGHDHHSHSSDHTHHMESAKDITNIIFTSSARNCADYANEYSSQVKDINKDTDYSGYLKVSLEGGKCTFSTNAIPNHDFNDGSDTFVHNVSEQDITYTIPQAPTINSEVTKLSLGTDNAVFLNGVKLDLLAAGCFGVGNGFIGCGNTEQPFRYDPMSPLNDFGTDSHNAHTQPDGAYHYHGNPLAMFSDDNSSPSPVIGFAADGFPIYGSYFDDNGTIRKAKSNYVLKDNGGPRKDISFAGKTYAPGGNYNGQFIDDYVYDVSSGGDLDECNGMFVDGHYGYYVTDNYPWVLKCFKGTPDSSFNKAPPEL
ncbi:YHYH protein [Reinekea thalattae]|uniref:YHYH protein n=1 Tax=Reinekea thalattae TaxID=2593301 RepID=A0A5C8ZBE1_9GAMM|nr:YHYH protein [Reinekea thalattae]TXR54501.1 YHYH protein [Reinekea thalattae]